MLLKSVEETGGLIIFDGIIQNKIAKENLTVRS